MSVAAVVLAAGAAARFGGGKLVAALHGRPILEHVLRTARDAGLAPIVVVVPPGGELDGIDLGDARRIVNPHPAEGLASSVRLGLRALELDDAVDAAVILLGDQPMVRADVVRRLLDGAADRPTTPFVAARYAGDGAPNPIVARRSIWRLADELAGDRGFGPILAVHPELVRFVDVAGDNPDIDTPADLARVARVAPRPFDG